MAQVIKQTLFEAEYNKNAYTAAFTNTTIIELAHSAGPPILIKRFAMVYLGGGSPSQAGLIINAIYEPNGNRNLLTGNANISFLGWNNAATDSARIYRNVEYPFFLASNQKLAVIATALSGITIGIGDIGLLIEGSIDIANPMLTDPRG